MVNGVVRWIFIGLEQAAPLAVAFGFARSLVRSTIGPWPIQASMVGLS